MQELIGRLIRCAVPRDSAVFLCHHFLRVGGIAAVVKYVEDVEAECRGEMDIV